MRRRSSGVASLQATTRPGDGGSGLSKCGPWAGWRRGRRNNKQRDRVKESDKRAKQDWVDRGSTERMVTAQAEGTPCVCGQWPVEARAAAACRGRVVGSKRAGR